MIDKDIYNFIEELGEESTEDILLGLIEEVGELALALHVRNGTKKRELKESAIVECIDVLLISIELFQKLGGKYEDLETIMRAKLSKWAGTVYANKHNKILAREADGI